MAPGDSRSWNQMAHRALRRGLIVAGVILDAVHGRLRSSLVVFGYFTAVGLLLFGYRYLERVASRDPISPFEPFIDEVLTGAWMAAVLFPFIARVARRFPLGEAS